MIVVCALVLLGGIGLLLYPTFADWWNRQHASRAVASYVEQVDNMDKEKKQAMLQQARDYNAKLVTLPDRWHLTDEEKAEYEKTLDVTGTGIMGYLSIPKLKTQLPIYHGTDETVLQIAGGHLEGTSLPVGGKDTHAAVSGHTGLPSAKLFTGLDSLVKGDTFSFTVLDETYTYQVDQIRTVLPTEMRDLDFNPEADYATLITCTPYGVNSHRLLVRGHRIPTPVEHEDQSVYQEANRNQTIAIGVALALVILFIAWITSIVIRRTRRNPRGRMRTTHASK
ncbi:MAG: class C sortase [Bifidobacteriaceae bacterium]|nr:class C sortase [Bifidobacteriaceae bacterium]